MRKRVWVLLALLAGCSRAEYRRAADRDAYALTASRIVCPEFDIGRTQIEPDHQSRLADPNCQDRPPKPPDDPSAAIFMKSPGGMKGSSRWTEDGCTNFIEHPEWLASLGLDDKGRLKLDSDKALDLALMHSREYQTSVEALYLTALDLSLARFQFSPQWRYLLSGNFDHFGSGPTETNTFTLSNGLGVSKSLAAGGQLLVDFANSFIWEVTNGTPHLVPANFLVSLVQPLLRDGGRAVRLEELTQAERTLLYQVRDFARFRKQFWADVTTSGDGYLSLLLLLQNIRNQEANLKSQEQNYRLHLELFNGGKISRVQVDRVFRDYTSARLGVAQSEASYQLALDAYKLRLGLPPRLPIDLDDSRLNQFQLVSSELEKLREEMAQFELARFRELGNVPEIESLRQSFERIKALVARAPAQFDRVQRELNEAIIHYARPPGPGQDPEQSARTGQDYERFRAILIEVKRDLDSLPGRIDTDRNRLTEAPRRESWQRLLDHARDLLRHLDDLIAAETFVKINRIELPELNDKEDAAIAEALDNRLDLMNQKARVTDAWRQVTIAANALRAGLSVSAAANLANDPGSGNPFGFSSRFNRYTLGFQFDAPLNRFAERNQFRASQIAYQQARRDYMALSDRIEQQIRNDLRQLAIERLSFETARQNLVSAARQVETARTQILNVRDPSNTNTTQDIQNALDALLSARNALARSYISYEQLRVRLILDLERMRLDSRGYPTDERSSFTPPAGHDIEPLPPPRPGR